MFYIKFITWSCCNAYVCPVGCTPIPVEVIPVVAIVDSNTDPNKTSYPIPANDDSLRTIQLLIGCIADAILEIKGSSKDSKMDGVQISKSELNNADDITQDEEE